MAADDAEPSTPDGPEPVPLPRSRPFFPTVSLPELGRYRGRRHGAEPGEREHGPGWIVVLLALGLLGAVILVLVSLPPRQHGSVSVPAGGAPILSDAPLPSPSSPEPSLSPSPSLAPSPFPSPSPSRRPSPPPRPFQPVTYEAEAPGNTLSGSAWVDSYPGASGGRIVRNLGLWEGMGRPGALQFNGVTVRTAGTYTLTLFYVHLDGQSQRSLLITVGSAQPFSLTVSGSATCCSRVAVRIHLAAGTNAIIVTNPDDHAPSLDRIVISAG